VSEKIKAFSHQRTVVFCLVTRENFSKKNPFDNLITFCWVGDLTNSKIQLLPVFPDNNQVLPYHIAFNKNKIVET